MDFLDNFLQMPKLVFILFLSLFLVTQTIWAESHPDLITKQPVNLRETIEKNKVALIFMDTYCPCIKNSLAELKEQIKKHGSEIQFIGINIHKNNPTAAVKIYKHWDLNIPLISDVQGRLLKQWNVTAVGTVVVLDKGILLYRGGIQFENGSPLLRTALDEIKTENKAQVKNDQGLGCLID